jgi:carbonic anhydrase
MRPHNFETRTIQAGSCELDDIKFEINDHSITANYKEDSDCTKPRMMIPDVTGINKPFDALQFHIHTGTDHAIDGKYYGADMHLVHKEVGGDRLAVLGFFLEPTSPSGIGKFSDLLTEWEAVAAETLTTCVNEAVPAGDGDTSTALLSGGGRRYLDEAVATKEEQKTRKLPRSFNPYGLIPGGSSTYFYDGSLTTPPCTEIVWWNLIDRPVSLSIREFLRLTNLILDYVDPTTCKTATVAAPSGFTGRTVQKINNRKITHLCPSGFQDPFIEFAERQQGNANDDPDNLSDEVSSSSITSLVIGVFSALVTTAALFV